MPAVATEEQQRSDSTEGQGQGQLDERPASALVGPTYCQPFGNPSGLK